MATWWRYSHHCWKLPAYTQGGGMLMKRHQFYADRKFQSWDVRAIVRIPRRINWTACYRHTVWCIIKKGHSLYGATAEVVFTKFGEMWKTNCKKQIKKVWEKMENGIAAERWKWAELVSKHGSGLKEHGSEIIMTVGQMVNKLWTIMWNGHMLALWWWNSL